MFFLHFVLNTSCVHNGRQIYRVSILDSGSSNLAGSWYRKGYMTEMASSRRNTKSTDRLLKLVIVGLVALLVSSKLAFSNVRSSDPLPRSDTHNLGTPNDVSMGGLLSARPEGDKCTSRIQHHLYRRKKSSYRPSKLLISKLRQYEALHHQCAPQAEDFVHKLNYLASNTQILLNTNSSRSSRSSSTPDCQFLVWMEYSGLGNRLVTIVAAFLYALLTNRVLLLDGGTHISELLCEPFPGASSWLLPSNIPKDWLSSLNGSSPHRFGALVNRGTCRPDVNDIDFFPQLAYLDLTHSYNVHDRRFFCESEQQLLSQVPWLFMRSDLYFVPSLFFMPSFRSELDELFPDRESIFHHLSRYLFHPSNSVWSRVSRFYDSYLRDADKLVGLQLRTMDHSSGALQKYLDQVLDCVHSNGVLPNVTDDDDRVSHWLLSKRVSTSVLVTSLYQVFYDKLKELYVRFPTEDSSMVKLHLPSHETWQNTASSEHNKKALMEIFLLSFCDELVTSPMSTFGYTANGLAGTKPWILRRLEDADQLGSSCSRVVSVDPCFHAPPLFDCDCQGGRDPAKVAPSIVTGCRDVPWGVQVVSSV